MFAPVVGDAVVGDAVVGDNVKGVAEKAWAPQTARAPSSMERRGIAVPVRAHNRPSAQHFGTTGLHKAATQAI